MVIQHRLPSIRPGDHIAVVSPAGIVKESKLHRGISAIEDRGFRVDRGKHLFARHRELAGNDNMRIEDLLWALRTPDIKAIFCARGGYGTSRLLSMLSRRGVGNIPKLIIGFSDTTALQWAMWTMWQWQSLSGPLVTELGGGITPEAEEAFWALTKKNPTPQLGYGVPSVEIIRHGEAKGILMPGCLAIICTLIGTPFMPDLSGAVLVIEDIGEIPFRIDRLLIHLKNAGIFDQISALVVGEFLQSDAKTDAMPRNELRQRLTEIIPDFHGPIVIGIPYGHNPNRWTLPVGITARLSTDPFAIETISNG